MGSIGRVFERVSSSVISPTGGIRPPGRRRGQTALRITEVEKISRGSSMRQSLRMIAQHLDCVPSTISHEIKRGGGSANCARQRLFMRTGTVICAPRRASWLATRNLPTLYPQSCAVNGRVHRPSCFF